MKLVSLHDKAELEAYMRQDPWGYLFELGDLDEFFWPYTVWYGHKVDGQIQQLALLYLGVEPPFFLVNPAGGAATRPLLKALQPLLPQRLFANVAPAHVNALEPAFVIQPQGKFIKMGLVEPASLDMVDTANVTKLTAVDLAALEKLYAVSYPDNLFAPWMVRKGWYYGLWLDGSLVSVAGLYVHSARYKVAAIGNVTTHPAYRRRGLSQAVCAFLCQDLRQSGIEHLGLTVKAENEGAIALYAGLGFRQLGEFGAFLLERPDVSLAS